MKSNNTEAYNIKMYSFPPHPVPLPHKSVLTFCLLGIFSLGFLGMFFHVYINSHMHVYYIRRVFYGVWSFVFFFFLQK